MSTDRVCSRANVPELKLNIITLTAKRAPRRLINACDSGMQYRMIDMWRLAEKDDRRINLSFQIKRQIPMSVPAFRLNEH